MFPPMILINLDEREYYWEGKCFNSVLAESICTDYSYTDSYLTLIHPIFMPYKRIRERFLFLPTAHDITVSTKKVKSIFSSTGKLIVEVEYRENLYYKTEDFEVLCTSIKKPSNINIDSWHGYERFLYLLSDVEPLTLSEKIMRCFPHVKAGWRGLNLHGVFLDGEYFQVKNIRPYVPPYDLPSEDLDRWDEKSRNYFFWRQLPLNRFFGNIEDNKVIFSYTDTNIGSKRSDGDGWYEQDEEDFSICAEKRFSTKAELQEYLSTLAIRGYEIDTKNRLLRSSIKQTLCVKEIEIDLNVKFKYSYESRCYPWAGGD
ncbi:MAG: hypothetical protein K2H01_03545 [Ruminococcus sp.]|nr:hypothetical protein [Ruminococcus sp.]